MDLTTKNSYLTIIKIETLFFHYHQGKANVYGKWRDYYSVYSIFIIDNFYFILKLSLLIMSNKISIKVLIHYQKFQSIHA